MNPSTSIALLADIHGNVAALDAALADVGHQAPDHVMLLGDLATNGPRPAETLQRIRAQGLRSVLGNMDAVALEGRDPVGAWTLQQLASEDVAYLRALPLLDRFSPTSGSGQAHDLVIMHSTPRSCFDLLVLEPNPDHTTFTAPTPEADAAAMLGGEMAAVMAFGHIHYVSSGVVAGQALRSIGSVGFPFDGDRRAAYTMALWNGSGWRFEDRRVSYDAEAVARDLLSTDIPFAERFAAMLREARWLPRPTS